MTTAHHRWTSGVGPLEQKLATFCGLLRDYDRSDTGSGHSTQPARVRPAHELLGLLAHGVASTPTEQFISQHLTELALGRLFKSLDGASPRSSPARSMLIHCATRAGACASVELLLSRQLLRAVRTAVCHAPLPPREP